MDRTIALSLHLRYPASPLESLRMVLVYVCALALIGAGPFFPGVAW